MKIAIATQDMTRINAHLGWARHFMMFEVSEEGYAYLETVTFDEDSADGDSGKLAPRLAALERCSLVFVVDVGPEGERALARARITPLRQFAGHPVVDALEELHTGLRQRRPAWLRLCQQAYRRDPGL